MGILIGLLLIGICACIITFLIQLKNSQKKVEQLNGQIHALTEYSETLLEKIRELSQKAYDENNQELVQLKESISKNTQELDKLTNIKTQLEQDISVLKNEQNAINAEILRRREVEEKQDFFRICLTNETKSDIDNLEKIRPLLTNKEALDKLIYNEFIRRPLDLMEKRVLKGSVSGIYKITRLKTGEIYIGRSTDVMKRWTEHVKSALGIGTIAHSYLHTVMAQDGLDQFTFELIEQCEKTQLNAREKFYIDFYGSKILLNEKAGG